jgi:NAD-dependent SIR2 family protein deacetylase
MDSTPGVLVENREALPRLEELVRHGRVLVLTGAGCSTESGIPDYRDINGTWKRRQPVRYQDFARSEAVRQRYWARSLQGWPVLDGAVPNRAHRTLAQLEESRHVDFLITQNVDGLHRKAGSRNVLDLHGCMDNVVCLSCAGASPHSEFQARLLDQNPHWDGAGAPHAPDGDADLEGADLSSFQVRSCTRCSGVLKPAVVLFGENVPAERVRLAMQRLRESRALLVAGSSLMVWSGFRFVKAAKEMGLPAAAINLGRTRADELFDISS